MNHTKEAATLPTFKARPQGDIDFPSDITSGAKQAATLCNILLSNAAKSWEEFGREGMSIIHHASLFSSREHLANANLYKKV